MYKNIELIFKDKVITLCSLFISLHTPFIKNFQAEFEALEGQYELLKSEVLELLKSYPFLHDHPMAGRIPQ